MEDLSHYFCCIQEQAQTCSTETEVTWKATIALQNSSFLFFDRKYFRKDIGHYILLLRSFTAINLDNLYFYYAKHTGVTLVEPNIFKFVSGVVRRGQKFKICESNIDKN